jgi:cellulose synthase/poly-beta-1,6-N-acetylglucosamine synthase-like glycosyltransferase
VINAVVPMVRGDIVVFADARQRFERDSVRSLVRNFADQSIGAVSGELVIETNGATMTAARGTALYWRYEKFIRSTEGRRDSTIGATGAIYAIRRELFEPIPEDTLLDDVLIPLRIVKRGFRVVFEPSARAYDVAAVSARQEFVRKARTSAGVFQLFARERWLLNPWRNRIWFETISHKGLRLTLPVLHAAAFAANAALVGAWPYDVLFAGQMLFYAAAVIGHTKRWHVFSIPCAICLHLWVIAVGFHRFLTNQQPATWERVVPASGGDVAVSIRPASAGRSEAA